MSETHVQENTAAPRAPWEPELITIPAGDFVMGTTRESVAATGMEWEALLDAETPQHMLYLPAYQIGRYPVSNREYREFVLATDYAYPAYWGGRRGGMDDYPVVGVTWYDALAYCRWLSEATGKSYILPSEAEWEKAARGPNGDLWPWGNQWDPAHYEVKGRGRTRWIGCTASLGSDSPYGGVDMIGNVWEWTRSVERPYPYDPDNVMESPASVWEAFDRRMENVERVPLGKLTGTPRIYRGCPQKCRPVFTRSASRQAYNPDYTRDSLGFRVAVL